MDNPERQVLRFQTTAKASADARALCRVGLVQFDLIVDTAALVFAGVLLSLGNLLGVLLAMIALSSLLGSRFHPFQRALIAFRYRNILGHTTEVVLGDDGLHYENPLGSSFVPWSSITAVRHNSRTVAFFRGSVLLGYLPSIAFDSPESQAAAVALSQSRIQSGH